MPLLLVYFHTHTHATLLHFPSKCSSKLQTATQFSGPIKQTNDVDQKMRQDNGACSYVELLIRASRTQRYFLYQFVVF